jgi:hypothetical protein
VNSIQPARRLTALTDDEKRESLAVPSTPAQRLVFVAGQLVLGRPPRRGEALTPRRRDAVQFSSALQEQ